jgi:hypothetical protein
MGAKHPPSPAITSIYSPINEYSRCPFTGRFSGATHASVAFATDTVTSFRCSGWHHVSLAVRTLTVDSIPPDTSDAQRPCVRRRTRRGPVRSETARPCNRRVRRVGIRRAPRLSQLSSLRLLTSTTADTDALRLSQLHQRVRHCFLSGRHLGLAIRH